jgi:2'-5' RNA ligase
MGEGKEKLAFWLVPSADAKARFTAVIEELARRLDAPGFEPHVTLQGGQLEQQRAIGLLEAVAAAHPPVTLRISGIEFSEKYTKTLYVQFDSSGDASAISDDVAHRLGSKGSYKFDPHLSLLYKTLPEWQKEELAREISFPLEEVNFDSLKLISVPREIKVADDVHAWRAIAERPLRGAAQ